MLVTFTMRHGTSYDELAAHLRFADDGIAPLLYVGAVEPTSGWPYRDVLVEIEPPGRSILERAPLAEDAVIRCGIAVAGILAVVHERLAVVGGLAPEVIYVDDETSQLTQLTPRSRRFVASVDLRGGGPTSYPVPYSGYEALVLGRGSDEAGDVFALCASLFHAATGKHPFGAHLVEILQRVTANRPLSYPGSPALGAILASGLHPDPNRRPRPEDLAAALAKLT